MNAKVTIFDGSRAEFEVKGFEDIEAGQIFTLFKSAAGKLVAAFLTARIVAVEIPENSNTTVLAI